MSPSIRVGGLILAAAGLLALAMSPLQTGATTLAEDLPPGWRPGGRLGEPGFEMPRYLPPGEAAHEPSLANVPPTLANWTRLVFQSYRDGNWEIYVANGDGTNQVRLTNDPGVDMQPSLNRGCTKVAFASNRTGSYEIYTVNLDGGGLTRLTSNSSDDVEPSWSPDGTRITFQSYRDGQAEVYTMNADGQGPLRLTYDDAYDGEPAWSPEGSEIAFIASRELGPRAWVMDADGSDEERVTHHQDSWSPAWRPAGTVLAYNADWLDDGWLDLYTINRDGTNNQMRYHPPEQNTDAWLGSYSPDGRYIAFSRITWILYNGYWYWTTAYIDAWDSWAQSTVRLSSEGTDWWPDWQSADLAPPSSSVSALSSQSPSPIPVSWSGTDPVSGIGTYDVQVRDGANGAWMDWLLETTATSSDYPGSGGHTYYFRCRARDNAGNLEEYPSSPDAFTTVEALAPVTAVEALPPFSRDEITVRWGGADPGGSGIGVYDVQTRDGSAGAWTDWKVGTAQTEAPFSGAPGHEYYFRSRGKDMAGNWEAYPPGDGDAVTTSYLWAITGRLYDNRETPVMGGEVSLVPEALVSLPSDANGSYAGYEASASSVYTATWAKAGYGGLPATAYASGPDVLADMVLPPADNVVQNWGLETGSLEPEWSAGGEIPCTITSTLPHTGRYAAALGGPQGMSESAFNVSGSPRDSRYPVIGVDGGGAVHIVWNQDNAHVWDVMYAIREPGETWSSPINLSSTDALGDEPRMAVQPDGTVHVVWAVHGVANDVLYARRSPGGTWSDPIDISNTVQSLPMALDIAAGSDGSVHVVWQESYDATNVFYARRSPQGSWSAAVNLSNTASWAGNAQVEAGPDGTAHAVWQQDIQDNDEILYAWRSEAGDWSAPLNISNLPGESGAPELKVSDEGTAHVIWRDSSTSERNVFYAEGDGDGPWSEPYNVSHQPFDCGDNPHLALGGGGSLHVVWDGVWYAHQDAQGAWSEPQHLADGYDPDLQADAAGRAHVTYWGWRGGEGEILYTWRSADGSWSAEHNVSDTVSPSGFSHLAVLGTRPHLVWEEATDPGYQWDVLYASPGISTVGAAGGLSQTVGLAPDAQEPTLSFWYRLEGTPAPGSSWLSVGVRDADGATPLFTATQTCSWTHEWLDLTGWAGEQVSLEFSIHQVEGQPFAWAVLDEVTAGSAYPDLWVAKGASSGSVPPGGLVDFTLTYGNRGGVAAGQAVLTDTMPAGLEFVSADPSPSTVTPYLTWALGGLPPWSGPATITLIAGVAQDVPPGATLTNSVAIGSASSELETLNNQAQSEVWIGWRAYLPNVARVR